jgi:hypothetical protein
MMQLEKTTPSNAPATGPVQMQFVPVPVLQQPGVPQAAPAQPAPSQPSAPAQAQAGASR